LAVLSPSLAVLEFRHLLLPGARTRTTPTTISPWPIRAPPTAWRVSSPP
jgi:hypothetical protein